MKAYTDSIKRVNQILDKRRNSKFNAATHCDHEGEECNCTSPAGGNPNGQKTDLIVLIDTSGSMTNAAAAISDAVTKAIGIAKKQCEPDLRLLFLGVDGVWNGTQFNQSHRDYIHSIHGTGVTLSADTGHVGLASEQGANAIQDLSGLADWREGACRAIFYISDEELDSLSPLNDFANETAVTNAAITAANANNVTVFAHHLTHLRRPPQIIQNYKDLCEKTGGEFFASSVPTTREYVSLLSKIICNSCGKSVCKEIDLPKLEPCISVRWGDSACDCLESSDHEVMIVTVCNCYKNYALKNFTITSIELTDHDGKPAPTLPNGKPSIQAIPIGVHCFGDIEPCTCVSREFVIICEGANHGKYKLQLNGICYDVVHPHHRESECFELEICRD